MCDCSGAISKRYIHLYLWWMKFNEMKWNNNVNIHWAYLLAAIIICIHKIELYKLNILIKRIKYSNLILTNGWQLQKTNCSNGCIWQMKKKTLFFQSLSPEMKINDSNEYNTSASVPRHEIHSTNSAYTFVSDLRHGFNFAKFIAKRTFDERLRLVLLLSKLQKEHLMILVLYIDFTLNEWTIKWYKMSKNGKNLQNNRSRKRLFTIKTFH